MQQVRVGATYLFESATYGGLYHHEVLAYEEETREHEARYRIRAHRMEVTDLPGKYSTEEGPVVAWHSAEKVHEYYAKRWS